MEGSHGELRTRLTDRLSGDDSDRFADLDRTSGREIASIAALADTTTRLTGQHRTDLDLFDTSFLDPVGQLLGELLVLRDDHLAGERVVDVFLRDAADDTVTQRLEDVSTLHDRRHGDAIDRRAVDLGDDHVLGDVDETPGQVSRVGGLERRIGQSLTGTVSRDEVLQDRQAFTEVRRNRGLDDLTRRLGHQSTHSGELADLLFGTSGSGVGHHEDRIELPALLLELLHVVEHLVGHELGRPVPDVDDLVVTLTCGNGTVEPLALDLEHRFARVVDDLFLLRRNDHVLDADRDSRQGGVEESHLLELVENLDGHVVAEVDENEVDQVLKRLLLHHTIDERHLFGEMHVQHDAADRGIEQLARRFVNLAVDDVLLVELGRQIDVGLPHPELDRRQELDLPRLECDEGLFRATEDLAFAFGIFPVHRQVVRTENQIL